MIEMASRESAEFHQSLDPMAEAVFSVTWAGEERSMNWFDTARELTERWHHQEQIRLATNRPGIMTRNLYYPVLDCFMRALPFTYRDRAGQAGTFLRFNVTGECGGSWYLYREGDRWVQVEEPRSRQVAETTLPQGIAWRIFTKAGKRNAKKEKRIKHACHAELTCRFIRFFAFRSSFFVQQITLPAVLPALRRRSPVPRLGPEPAAAGA